MAENKRYYWIKLKNTFMTSDAVDFLMSQKNGSDYVVLYQMLCLKTVNTNGELVRQIGEVIIPFDIDKIQRDCKYFSYDTIAVAMELFKKLGLIYEQENGYLKIANFNELVGSETSSAQRVREHRQRKALQCNNDVTQEKEYRERDKSIELKDEDVIYKESESVKKEEKKDTLAHGRNNNVILTDEEYAEFKKDRPHDYQQLIDELSEKVMVESKYQYNHSAWLRIFANTKDRQEKRDELYSSDSSKKNKNEEPPSYDIELALQRSMSFDPTKTKRGQ